MLTGFLQNNCSKQRLKLPGRCVRILEKDFTIDVFFVRNFEKQNKNYARKKFFCNADADADADVNADADADVNADADAEISKWPFPTS